MGAAPSRSKKAERGRWAVPRDWVGETAFILGGGPSLAKVDVASLRGRGRVIAINDAGLTVAPWADVHYAADRVWYKWKHNQERLDNFQGTYRIARQVPPPLPRDYNIKVMAWEAGQALSRNRTRIAGRCGGANSINLAFLFGARRIILLGFDMRPGSWHGLHRRTVGVDSYRGEYIPALMRMAVELTREGVRVINATPGSALTCFPIMEPQEAIRMAAAKTTTETPDEDRPVAKRATEVLGLRRGATVIEFGAFDPSVTRALKKAGMKVATVAPDEGGGHTAGVVHTKADLARLPGKMAQAEYGICETLSERVTAPNAEATLRSIAGKVSKAAYFRIGTRMAHGPRPAKRQSSWWLGKCTLAFRSAELLSDTDGVVEIVCRHD